MKEDAAKYKICCRYILEMHNYHRSMGTKRSIYDRIHNLERRKFELDDTFVFPYKSAMSRVSRSSLEGGNNESPLIFIEDKLVDLVLCMNNIKRSLSVSEGLRLVNELIVDTNMQERLMMWKIQNNIYFETIDDLGRVGTGYWRRFLKRNHHRLRSKTGRKFGSDRANYSSYLNFMDMYNHIMSVLLESCKIAKKLRQPVWMDKEGNTVEDEMQGFGCKVEIEITRPDMAIVMDEVGCNLSQEMDHGVGGQRYLTGVNEEAVESVSTRSHHFTCLGLTRLDGEPLMCVVIIAGKTHDIAVELGIDWLKLNDFDMDGNDMKTNTQFVKDNMGMDKLLPGAPTCMFKGKQVPAFVTFNEGGGMNGWILTEILKRIDHLGLYSEDRNNGMTPFLLIDGHQSRFDLNFLKYINDENHHWGVCIGVPYGTALWQVADSSEQNGVFKMELTKRKKEIYDNRLNSLQHSLQLLKTDIIPLVNHCWPKAFGNLKNNRKAIAERGWYPYNRALLLDETIRAKMTEQMIEDERVRGIFPFQRLPELFDVDYVNDNGNIFLRNTVKTIDSRISAKLNFDGGVTARHVSNTIMTEVDRQTARERNQQARLEGTTAKDRLMAITKRLTSGKLTSEGRHYHMNTDVLEHISRTDNNSEEKLGEKRRKEDLRYLQSCYIADEVIEKHAGKPFTLWTNASDMIKYLRPLKHGRTEGKMPTKKPGLAIKYLQWSHRQRRQIVGDRIVTDQLRVWIEARKSSATSRGTRK